MILIVHRTHHLPECTLGELVVIPDSGNPEVATTPIFMCATLEPPIVNSKASSFVGLKGPIPTGTYRIVFRQSPKFGRLMPYVEDVPNFTGIMIHPGNTARDTRGCILVGDNPRIRDLENSRDCLTEPIPDKESASNRGSQGGRPLSDNDLGRVLNSRATFAALVSILQSATDPIYLTIN